jgi:DNA/RNA endonuclease YhcR with UshA esterase domain
MIVMLTLLTYQCIADLYFPSELLLMFERQERLALLMLVGVVIMVVAAHLILENAQKRSFAAPFSNISHDGDLVYLSGMIDHLVITKNGGHLIFEINNASVFIPGQIASNMTLHNGENISVVGVVQTYQGKKEVVVQSGSDIASNS